MNKNQLYCLFLNHYHLLFNNNVKTNTKKLVVPNQKKFHYKYHQFNAQ